MTMSNHIEHSTSGATLADLLERILDKGIVIAGDIKVKIVDIELLTIQIRLLICSVDKAKEIGVDWWVNHPAFSARRQDQLSDSLLKIEERLAKMESPLPAGASAEAEAENDRNAPGLLGAAAKAVPVSQPSEAPRKAGVAPR